MKLIAIETSTEACSAALYVDGKVLERYRVAPREHTELILPMVDELLAEAGVARNQLELVAFGRGPGAFTGVRIGTSVAQGIAFALQLPVVPVSTLAALAHGAWRELGQERVVAAIDARMAEIYCACYQITGEGVAVLHGNEQLLKPADLSLPSEGEWFGVGSGWQSYGDELAARHAPHLSGYDGVRYPRAHDIALLAVKAAEEGRVVSASEAQPVYLRDQVVQRPNAAAK